MGKQSLGWKGMTFQSLSSVQMPGPLGPLKLEFGQGDTFSRQLRWAVQSKQQPHSQHPPKLCAVPEKSPRGAPGFLPAYPTPKRKEFK